MIIREMGDRGAHSVGMKHAPLTVDQSVGKNAVYPMLEVHS